MNERTVAKLRAPLPARALSALIRGLEAAYGPGLRLVQEDDGWFEIWLPEGDQEREEPTYYDQSASRLVEGWAARFGGDSFTVGPGEMVTLQEMAAVALEEL